MILAEGNDIWRSPDEDNHLIRILVWFNIGDISLFALLSVSSKLVVNFSLSVSLV